ncbi:MAG: NAD-dependent deacetylase [Myxococcota bacterium]|jgi:NAD-dependent deacetylase
MDAQLKALLLQAAAAPRDNRPGRIVALTGAGISAESGIPTFRGEEGFWIVGSREYRPQEMATNAMFQERPDAVWPWYLYRRSICRAAQPNPAHQALVTLERALPDRFLLVTQNVDGLHLRAGNSLERTYQIHGNVDYMRCAAECDPGAHFLLPVPDGLDPWDKDRAITQAEWDVLVCPKCGGRTRPHVLWFDEYYTEELYRYESSIRAASDAALLLIVGTAGATNLPNQMVQLAARSGAVVVDINPSSNPFGELADQLSHGYSARGGAGDHLPEMVQVLIQAASEQSV